MGYKTKNQRSAVQHSPPRQNEGLVRIGPLLCIPSILSELSQAPEPVLRRAGFHPEQFTGDPDRKISFVAGSQLIDCCVEATGCQHFGLLMGKGANCSSLGIAGFMMRFAPTVGEALRSMVEHLELHDQGGVPLLETYGEFSSLGFAVYQIGADAIDQIYDLSATMICNMMRDLCGQSWNPTEVLLSRHPPPQQAPYEQFFRAPIRFNAEKNAVVFSTRWLNQPLPSADPLLFRHLVKEANEQQLYQTTNTTEKVRRLLRKSLAQKNFTATDIARHLFMHERTLHRHLQEEGTSYRQELENIRLEIAKKMLAKSDMPLAIITKALGYSDTSAFVRSFKRWTGHTPSQWRSLDGPSEAR
ncbi:MAG: AraC family transcriptional regulator [Chromatiales bacterium]|jgi:AraC-like DNA-binding protein